MEWRWIYYYYYEDWKSHWEIWSTVDKKNVIIPEPEPEPEQDNQETVCSKLFKLLCN